MIIAEKKINGGDQIIHKFNNGYGASVVKHDFSYGGKQGLWELAVIYFYEDDWSITYNTEITNDVLGNLTDKDVTSTLNKIEKLKG